MRNLIRSTLLCYSVFVREKLPFMKVNKLNEYGE